MKININVKSIGEIAQKHFSIVLGLCLAVVVIMEFFVIKRSVDMILSIKNQTPNLQTRIVRVNLPLYMDIEKRIEANNNYTASGTPASNPFGLPPQTTK